MDMANLTIWGATGAMGNTISRTDYHSKLIYVALEASKHHLKNKKDAETFIQTLPLEILNNYIGNSTCFELTIGEHHIILDAGSGFLDFGRDLISRYKNGNEKIPMHIFFSHFHWDHIIGLAFSSVLFNPRCHIHFYSKFEKMHEMLSLSEYPYFAPVNLDMSPSQKEFTLLKNQPVSISENIKILHHDLYHPNYGDSTAYRIEFNENGKNKTIVFATDGEYKMNIPHQRMKEFIAFFKNADVLIIEAQFLFGEAIIDFKDWGHTSPIFGVYLAILAGVKKILLHHHDRQLSDHELVKRLKKVQLFAENYTEKMNLKNCPIIDLALEKVNLQV